MYAARQKISEASYRNYLRVRQKCEAHRDSFKQVILTYEETMDFLFGKTKVTLKILSVVN